MKDWHPTWGHKHQVCLLLFYISVSTMNYELLQKKIIPGLQHFLT